MYTFWFLTMKYLIDQDDDLLNLLVYQREGKRNEYNKGMDTWSSMITPYGNK